MINSLAGLAYAALAIVLLFVGLILWGLRSRRQWVAAASDQITAAVVWSRYGDPRWPRADIIYGVNHDFSMSAAGWLVKDDEDRVIGRIAGTLNGVILEATGKHYRIVTKTNSRLQTSFTLYHLKDGNLADEACLLQAQGWLGTLSGRFSSPQIGSILLNRGLGLKGREKYNIFVNGALAGRAGIIDRYRPKAKVLVLTSNISLPVRIFLLWLV